ncbi:hypothetical protein [Nonomuraea sp. PA05]|uniref:hypothetical protein n=1 Tax=Nonomuraea sp. PA05 TaxID=2604466 RepID=UPI001652ACD1|nr:hypothetical protein [Nonomuraea sp. PA05]
MRSPRQIGGRHRAGRRAARRDRHDGDDPVAGSAGGPEVLIGLGLVILAEGGAFGL